ncbi:hypothetical protein ACWDUL_38755 [Nocardia niigatensis]
MIAIAAPSSAPRVDVLGEHVPHRGETLIARAGNGPVDGEFGLADLSVSSGLEAPYF